MTATAEKRQAVLDAAAVQFGLFTTAEVLRTGMTRSALRAWVESGAVRAVRTGVWSVAGTPDSPERRGLAAVLALRHPAALAVASAAWVWELPGHRMDPVELMSVRNTHCVASGRAHSSTRLDRTDVTVRRGLPVTTPTRTIFDLAGRQHPERTRRDLNNLTGRGLVTPATLHEQLDRLAGRGRPGIAVMRELIDAVDAGERPTESGLELRARDILAESGFTGLDQQVVLGDADGVIARVDLCDRGRRIVFEIDSDRFHGGLLDRMLDAEKTRRLEAIGWFVVRITEHEIFWSRLALVARLRALRTSHPGPNPRTC